MNLKTFRATALALALAATCGLSHALPQLQLGIVGGTYDPVSQTTIASGSSFTLYAFLSPVLTGNQAQRDAQLAALLADPYYISAAVVPKTGPANVNAGSFTFASTLVNVTGDMTYGVPPIDTIAALVGSDAGDLADHGIFDTFFKQFTFNFSSGAQTAPADMQTNGLSSTFSPSGSGMYYASFAVDTGLLGNNINGIHFDLYSSTVCQNGQGQCNTAQDVDINKFAPFSHDAGSGGGGGPPQETPEPATLALLGLGLVGAAMARRRKKA